MADNRELIGDLVGHPLARGLVFGIQDVAKGIAGGIKDDSQRIGLFAL